MEARQDAGPTPELRRRGDERRKSLSTLLGLRQSSVWECDDWKMCDDVARRAWTAGQKLVEGRKQLDKVIGSRPTVNEIDSGSTVKDTNTPRSGKRLIKTSTRDHSPVSKETSSASITFQSAPPS
jgi:hypothetical protein